MGAPPGIHNLCPGTVVWSPLEPDLPIPAAADWWLPDQVFEYTDVCCQPASVQIGIWQRPDNTSCRSTPIGCDPSDAEQGRRIECVCLEAAQVLLPLLTSCVARVKAHAL